MKKPDFAKTVEYICSNIVSYPSRDIRWSWVKSHIHESLMKAYLQGICDANAARDGVAFADDEGHEGD